MPQKLSIREYKFSDHPDTVMVTVSCGNIQIFPPIEGTADNVKKCVGVMNSNYDAWRQDAKELASNPQFAIPHHEQKNAATTFLSMMIGLEHYDTLRDFQSNGKLGGRHEHILHEAIKKHLSKLIDHPDDFILDVVSDCNHRLVKSTKRTPFQTMPPTSNSPITIDIQEKPDSGPMSIVVTLTGIFGDKKNRFFAPDRVVYDVIESAAKKFALSYNSEDTQPETTQSIMTVLLLELLHKKDILAEAVDENHRPSLEAIIKKHRTLIVGDPIHFIDTVSKEFQDFLESQREEKPVAPKKGKYYINSPYHPDDAPENLVTEPYMFYGPSKSPRGNKQTYLGENRGDHPNTEPPLWSR